MKEKIIEYAKNIGIDCIGFCDITFDSDFLACLKTRREQNMLSGFEEKDEMVRTNIKALMEDAQTIISIALPYKTQDDPLTLVEDSKAPCFSKSSRGLDYHNVMKNKLDILCKFLYNEYGAKTTVCCDTSPLPDREIAKMSGIGFYGKNSNIITKTYGSYVFLGEIITDLKISADNSILDSCGECEVCIKACPVKAIEKPYLINTQKCLSFISQKKEKLTNAEMDNLGNRVYGCDTCQDVCPRNKGKNFTKLKEFFPEEWNVRLDEKMILNMSNKEFKLTFGKTSSGWRGKKLLQRNLIIAMGNSNIKDYVPILEKVQDENLIYYADYAVKKLKNI